MFGPECRRERSAVSHSERPSLSRAAIPCSNHSSRDIQNSFLPFMISANTAPPKNTMCFRRGGSSILILNFCKGFIQASHSESKTRRRQRKPTFKRVGSPFSTRVRYSCFISFSRREGSPGYILEPPESTICLYSSDRTSTAADWMVVKSISVGELGAVLEWGKEVAHRQHRVVRRLRDVVETCTLVPRTVLGQF